MLELTQRFPDEASARAWFEGLRWPKGAVICPRCGSGRVSGVPNERPMPYHCAGCRKYFSVQTGSVMQSSRLPLQKWLVAIYLMSTSLKGVSSLKMHRDLGITQKTAWILSQKIREGWIDGGGDKLDGSVEVDETYIGGLQKNKPRRVRAKSLETAGGVGKQIVVGLKERGGRVKVKPVANTGSKTLQEVVRANVRIGASVYTDEAPGYKGLAADYDHHTVNHSAWEYVEGQAHTNGIESFWSMLKRGYKGTYHTLSTKHLHRYATEFAGRHNVRTHDTLAQMALLSAGLFGKRLSYKELTA